NDFAHFASSLVAANAQAIARSRRTTFPQSVHLILSSFICAGKRNFLHDDVIERIMIVSA
ncbi:MAG TPA: hypothetical protein VN933_15440, partial [Candidatus Eremiobacteraceae bacterium]|nr:hypothetical protein [Candidatus Eremiobacteraceae bacterium]